MELFSCIVRPLANEITKGKKEKSYEKDIAG